MTAKKKLKRIVPQNSWNLLYRPLLKKILFGNLKTAKDLTKPYNYTALDHYSQIGINLAFFLVGTGIALLSTDPSKGIFTADAIKSGANLLQLGFIIGIICFIGSLIISVLSQIKITKSRKK